MKLSAHVHVCSVVYSLAIYSKALELVWEPLPPSFPACLQCVTAISCSIHAVACIPCFADLPYRGRLACFLIQFNLYFKATFFLYYKDCILPLLSLGKMSPSLFNKVKNILNVMA